MTSTIFSSRRRGALSLAGLVATAAIVVVSGWMASPAIGAADKRTCGTLPGDGAYSYVRTKNVSCKIAQKVSNKAGRKFCGKRFQDCDRSSGGGFDKGRVRAKGWRCEMKVGYEFYRAECRRRNMKFHAESGA